MPGKKDSISKKSQQVSDNKPIMWAIVAAILGLVILIVVGKFFVTQQSESIRFITVNALSLFVLVAIVVQAFIYHRQRDVMERQLKAAEKAAEAAYIAQRAYIGVTDLMITSTSMAGTAQLVVGEIPTLRVTWHNGGNTPARNFRAVPYLVFGEKPERRGYLLGDDMSDIKGSFLPAGKEQTVSYPQVEVGFKPVTIEMINDLNSGKKRLYAMILAAYVDFTGKDRWLENAAIYKPEQGSFAEVEEYYDER
jgi:hypothetical protein